jgi:hypothetical protein
MNDLRVDDRRVEENKNSQKENSENYYEDPRLNPKSMKKVQKSAGQGRNTESFDPRSTLVRPDVRIHVGIPSGEGKWGKHLKHDDVVIVPNFACDEDDWTIYNQLVQEMRELQTNQVKGSEWISWHEGAHLISQNPTQSKTFQSVLQKMKDYFAITNESAGTRFNWYRDSADWKPFHHDSAAFNPQRARNQNITVGVSFGVPRELALLHAKSTSRLYFPQRNGMLVSFGRDGKMNLFPFSISDRLSLSLSLSLILFSCFSPLQ